MANSRNHTDIVFVDGCRTPFQKSGTGFRSFQACDLAQFALKGLTDRVKIDPAKIDRIILGSAVPDSATSNIAREAVIRAGLPVTIPAHTVTMACLSGHQAVTSGIEQILCGQAEVVIAGGVDSISGMTNASKSQDSKNPANTPDRHLTAESGNPEASRKSGKSWIKRIPAFRFANQRKELPVLIEQSTGESMGAYTDRLAAMYDVSREVQDAYAVRSHQSAVKAYEDGHLEAELVPVAGPPDFDAITRDNGFREDSTPQKLATLKPAFTKKHGTVTAGNASFLTDGASAVLIMTQEKADALGLTAKVRLKSYVYTAHDPKNDLLMGPAFAIPKLLGRAKLKMDDIDVFEIHEPFAGQIIAILKALSSDEFARKHLGGKKAAGRIPLKKLNTLGGSLSLGHPFGATGTRLLTTAANRLIREKGRYAVISSCAGGGMGHAMLLETVSKP